MSSPAVTGSGEPLLVTSRSAEEFTLVVSVAVLFAGIGSEVVLVTLATLVIVAPLGVAGLTVATTVKVALALAAKVALVAVSVPGTDASRLKAGPLV